MKLKKVQVGGVLLITFLIFWQQVGAAGATAFASPYFQQLWEYSDKLVSEQPSAGRGYSWGPVSLAQTQEDYLEGTGGKRLVQYFDKSRMELSADGRTVTNGLLTRELVTGNRQDGNSSFTQLTPSQIQIAGDDNSNGGNALAPTYASFKGVVTFDPSQNRASNQTGQLANLAINRAGSVSMLGNPPATVKLVYYEPTLGHNVADVFQIYQNLKALVWTGTGYSIGPVFTENPVSNVFGFPISEPYWVHTLVNGQEQNVLVQLFERRVLTYTPANPESFKVEMGNIGQHYYRWRYGSAPPTSSYWIPGVQTSWQWQLSGTPIDLGVEAQMYDIDLFDNSASTLAALHNQNRHVVCYISVGSWEDWRPDAGDFPQVLLGNNYEGWAGEKWLDIRRLDLLGPIMEKRFDQCKAKGFDAIEPDNIDGYLNKTGFSLNYQDQLQYNRWLAQQAHKRGLSIGLKNDSAQLADLLTDFDWALMEECFDQGWCDQLTPFIKAGKAVFAAEYTDNGTTLSNICSRAKSLSINVILKNRELDAWRQTCP